MSRSSRDPGVSAPMVQAAVRVLRELGVAIEDPPEKQGYVAGLTADAVLEAGQKAKGDSSIGLTVAENLAPGSLGPLDYILFTSETWGGALETVVKYYAVATERVRLALETKGTETAVVFTREPPYEQNRNWVELSLGVVTERARQSLGAGFQVERVQFAHSAPADGGRHERWFGAPVKFDAPDDRLWIATKWMAATSRTAMASLAKVLESRLAELVPPDADATMLRIRDAISRGLERGIELPEVATQLAMSTRTLQRALSQRGVSFKDVVDDLRRARALEYLREGKTIAEVASLIGFSDPSALFRAYRRWTGTTPGADRE